MGNRIVTTVGIEQDDGKNTEDCDCNRFDHRFSVNCARIYVAAHLFQYNINSRGCFDWGAEQNKGDRK